MNIKAYSTRHQKVLWLAAHRELWEGWMIKDPRARGLVDKMREARLISPYTYWKDVRLNNLIHDAREHLRSKL